MTAPAPAQRPLVFTSSVATFMEDVVAASNDGPILVDFWAPWCGPCKQLGPVLEKLVQATKGAVRLAKVDIEADPQIAQQMRIQSIPAVFAFYRGQPIDGFMGVQPEAQVKAWIEKLIKATGAVAEGQDETWVKEALAQAEAALTEGDALTAQTIFTEIHDRDPDRLEAMAGLMRALIAQKKPDEARTLFAHLSPEQTKAAIFDAVRATLALLDQAQQAVAATDTLEAKLAQNPDDHQSRFDLALAAYAAGDREKAVDNLLDIIRRNRSWNDDAARLQLLKLFEAFGPTDPLTVAARKRLSSLLFA
jgi:putative thioredoxin